jgi:hypothetical protein
VKAWEEAIQGQDPKLADELRRRFAVALDREGL